MSIEGEESKARLMALGINFNSGYCSMKLLGVLGVFTSPPGWGHRWLLPNILSSLLQQFADTYASIWVERGTVRVKSLTLGHKVNQQ